MWPRPNVRLLDGLRPLQEGALEADEVGRGDTRPGVEILVPTETRGETEPPPQGNPVFRKSLRLRTFGLIRIDNLVNFRCYQLSEPHTLSEQYIYSAPGGPGSPVINSR